MRRWRLYLVMLGLIVLLPVGAVWYLAWQGEREWESTRNELVAKGEKLTVTELAPGPVEDERNFFGDSIWKEIVEKRVGVTPEGGARFEPKVAKAKQQLGLLTEKIPENEVEVLKKAWPRFAGLDFELPRIKLLLNLLPDFQKKDDAWRADWAGFSLAVLKPAEPLLERIGGLCKRPEARFPIAYEDGPSARLTHIPPLMTIGQAFLVKGRAEMQQRQNEAATSDVLSGLALSHVLRDDLLVIGYLVRTSLAAFAVAAIEQGISTHSWSEDNLRAFEVALRDEEFLPGLVYALRGERGTFNTLAEKLHRGGYGEMARATQAAMSGVPGFTPKSAWEQSEEDFFMSGYLRLFLRYDQASENRLVQQMIERIGTKGWRGMNSDSTYHLPSEYEKPLYGYTHLLTKLTLPAILGAFTNVAHMQDRVVQARLAIALERYYLAHNEYPETLEALAPEYLAELPVEVLTGKPMHYKRTDKGAFLLWADGWDGKDDGGKANERHHLYEDDWVWGRP